MNQLNDKCPQGSPIIHICRFELGGVLLFAFVMGWAARMLISYFG